MYSLRSCPNSFSFASCSVGSLGTLAPSMPCLSLRITLTSRVNRALQYFLLSPISMHCETSGIDFIVSSMTSGAMFLPAELTYISLMRPVTLTYPSESSLPRSPDLSHPSSVIVSAVASGLL